MIVAGLCGVIVDECFPLGLLWDVISNEVGVLKVANPDTVDDKCGLGCDILFVPSENELVSELTVWYAVGLVAMGEEEVSERVEFSGENGDVGEVDVKLYKGLDTVVVEVAIREDASVLPKELIGLVQVDEFKFVISVEDANGDPPDENLGNLVDDDVSKVVLDTLMVDGAIEGVKEAVSELDVPMRVIIFREGVKVDGEKVDDCVPLAVPAGEEVVILELSCVTVEEMGIDGNGLAGLDGALEMGVMELFLLVVTTTLVEGADIFVIKDVDLVADGEELLTKVRVAILSEVDEVEVIDADGIRAVDVFTYLVDVTKLEDEIVPIDEFLGVDAVGFDILVYPLGTGLLLEGKCVVDNDDTGLDEFAKVVVEGPIEEDNLMVPVENVDDFVADDMALLDVSLEEACEVVDQ